MIRQETEYGAITLESNVYRNIAGLAASNCFGVKGMAARSRTDGLIYLLRKESSSKGVAVTSMTTIPSPSTCISWSITV